MELPVLDARLALIASMVRPGRTVADIGADHGYLVTWLVASGTCPSGVAADINAQPLARAALTAKECGVMERIALIQCDGLSALEERDAEDLIIAGMGGDTIAQILEAAAWHTPDKRFLLQPMTHAAQLRRWLCKNGYAIEMENAALAGRFCYTVMTVRFTGETLPCSEVFAHAGLLPERNTPEARAYVRAQACAAQKKARGLARSGSHEAEYLAASRLACELYATIGEDL